MPVLRLVIFSALLLSFLRNTPAPTLCLGALIPAGSGSLSSYWLSRAGPAGRLTPRRTTALRESSRRGRALRAPACSTPGVATSLVTDAWRKGGCGARDLRPTLHQPGPRRAGRWHCAVTVPGRWGDAPRLCYPGSREGTGRPLQARPRERAFACFAFCLPPLGELAGGSRSGGGAPIA